MASKIVAFCSSPRKNSNSEILCDQILAGASEAGAEIEKIKLHGMSIKTCTGCGACSKSVEEPCIFDDDMTALIEKIRTADGIVFASPIYFFTVNAQMKLFMDRWVALFGGGQYDAIAGKKAAVALTYGAEDVLESGATCAYDMYQQAMGFLGVELVGCAHGSCYEAGAIKQNVKAMEAARKLGQKLAEKI